MMVCPKDGKVEELHVVEGNVEKLVCPACGAELGRIIYGPK
jgi:predicted RNA-binding Zn-ribbon protein involved in translation (DUF1610 family)